jgi:hypothetical protein
MKSHLVLMSLYQVVVVRDLPCQTGFMLDVTLHAVLASLA